MTLNMHAKSSQVAGDHVAMPGWPPKPDASSSGWPRLMLSLGGMSIRTLETTSMTSPIVWQLWAVMVPLDLFLAVPIITDVLTTLWQYSISLRYLPTLPTRTGQPSYARRYFYKVEPCVSNGGAEHNQKAHQKSKPSPSSSLQTGPMAS